MGKLKYTVIKDQGQYMRYCNLLEELVTEPEQTKELEEEIELVTTLIEIWDDKHNSTKHMDPVQLLRSFIKDHKLKPGEAMKVLGITSRGHYSEIMNYQKGFSKEVIRRLAEYFKVSQEAFNRPYPLKKKQAKIEGETVRSRVKYKRTALKPKPARTSKANKKFVRTNSKMKALEPA